MPVIHYAGSFKRWLKDLAYVKRTYLNRICSESIMIYSNPFTIVDDDIYNLDTVAAHLLASQLVLDEDAASVTGSKDLEPRAQRIIETTYRAIGYLRTVPSQLLKKAETARVLRAATEYSSLAEDPKLEALERKVTELERTSLPALPASLDERIIFVSKELRKSLEEHWTAYTSMIEFGYETEAHTLRALAQTVWRLSNN